MVKKIKAYINRSEFTKNTVTLFTGTTVAQVIPVLISPVLSRLFSPGDFGLLALYMSISGILAVIATGRYEMAIMLPKKDEDAMNILAVASTFLILVSIIIFIPVVWYNQELSKLTGNEQISFYLYFLPFTVFSLGFYKVLMYHFNRENQFKKIAVSKVMNASVNSFMSLVLGLFKKGSLGLIFSWIIGQMASMIYLFVKMRNSGMLLFSQVSYSRMIALAKRYKKFPLFDTWSELLNVLSVELPIILLIHFFGENVTGYFSFTYKVLLLPFSLIAFSIGQAYFKKASSMKDSQEAVSNFTFSVFRKMVLISFVPLAIMAVFGDLIFPFVFGGEWNEAGRYSRVFSIWVFTIFITSPLTNIFAIYEKQRTNLAYNLTSFIVRTGLLLFLAKETEDAFTTIFWYVISGFLFRFIYLIIIVKVANMKILLIFLEIFKFTLPFLLLLLLIRSFIM
jgi:O-antigen/teichoic acid export membrane protein